MLKLQFTAQDKAYLDELTESNAHGERLYETALICLRSARVAGDEQAEGAFQARKQDFAVINRDHELAGSLSYELSVIREFCAKRLRVSVIRYFGRDAAKDLGLL